MPLAERPTLTLSQLQHFARWRNPGDFTSVEHETPRLSLAAAAAFSLARGGASLYASGGGYPVAALGLPSALRANGARVNAALAAIDAIGRARGGINRVAYSDADLASRAFTLGLMRQATPREFTKAEDVANGVDVLLNAVIDADRRLSAGRRGG